jgi:hypothetical protein
MAGATDEFGGEYPSAWRSPQPVRASSPTAAPPTLSLAAMMAELGASRELNERQAMQIFEQAQTIDLLRSDMEATATEVIGLKIREHRLMNDVARKMTELQSLRAELAAARATSGKSEPTHDESGWPYEQDRADEPILGLSRRWCVLTSSVAVVAATAAWVLSAGFPGFHW